METIFVSAITSLLVAGGLYWYLHKKNPDLAQKVTDTLVEDVKAPVEKVTDAVQTVQEQVTEAVDAVKKD